MAVHPHQPLSFGRLLCFCSTFLPKSQHKLDRFPLKLIRRLVVVSAVLLFRHPQPSQSPTNPIEPFDFSLLLLSRLIVVLPLFPRHSSP